MKARAHYARKRPPPVLVLAILSRSGMSKPRRRRVRKAVVPYEPPPMIVNTGDPFMKI